MLQFSSTVTIQEWLYNANKEVVLCVLSMQSYAAIKMVMKTTEIKKVNDGISKAYFLLIGIDDKRVLRSNKFVKCCMRQINRFLNYQISQSLKYAAVNCKKKCNYANTKYVCKCYLAKTYPVTCGHRGKPFCT